MNAAAAPLMSTTQLLIWSATVGAIGLVVLLAAIDAAFNRTRASVQTLAYLLFYWLFVALLCGLAVTIWPPLGPIVPTAQILMGPLGAAMGSYGCSQWLSAHKRDRLMKVSLQTVTWMCLLGAPLCLLLVPHWRLPASAALSVMNMSVASWLCVRAAQLGDRLAWGLGLGCALSLPVQVGLYGMALGGNQLSLGLQAGVATLALLSVLVTAVILWLRNRHAQRLSQAHLSQRDPITQLYSSMVIVQKIINAQRRRVRTRRDGALMAVLLFEPERLLTQVGQVGLNDIYIQMAQRMRRHTGVVNPAGRYYDRCFVVLVETLHSPRWIRTLGLRVASSLRRPVEVTSLTGERITITVNIAVGIVHMSAVAKDADQLLHEVQRVAEAARQMRSRAALLDPESRQAVPVESADLGNSWRAMREQKPAAGKAKKTAIKGAAAKSGPVRIKPV
ncbi:MAG: GGDEF domain-containing protein [Polaromonas sp.]|nr:GGDEF domain-containing protein [Polaromonas sp.]